MITPSKKYKAKYIKTVYINKNMFNPYKSKQYSYRGKTYWLDFDLADNYLGIEINAAGGHQYNQQLIDDKLDNSKESVSIEDAEVGFNLFYDYCEGKLD